MRRSLLPLTALAALFLAGCATTTVPVKPAAPPLRGRLGATSGKQNDLFYHVLVGDIAGQQGHLGLAAQAFGKAAEESHNQSLIRRSALLSLYARRYGQARHLARLWRAASPKSAGALEALADAHLGLGKIKLSETEMGEALRLVTAQEGSGGRAFAYEHIATLLLQQQPSPNVLAVMTVLHQDYPQDAVGEYVLADAAWRYHHDGQAVRVIGDALKLKPHWEDAAVLKARILWRKSPRAALRFSSQFLQMNPDATRLRLDYARRLVSLQYWQQALAQFRVISEETPNDPQVLYAAGLLALRTHQSQLARTYLKRSLLLQPENGRVKLYLGEIAERQRRFARARYYFRQIQPPYRFQARVRLALMPLKESHPNLAWQKLKRVVAHGVTEDVTLALARNQVLVVLHHYARALAVLGPALQVARHKSALLYARALDEEKLGQVAATESDLEALLGRHPHDPLALNALGYTFINHKQHEKRGLALVHQALDLDPADPYVLDSLGWGYYRLGHPKTALPYLRKAFRLSGSPTVATHLGVVLWALGQHAAALQVWRAAQHKAPANSSLNRQLAKHAGL